MTALLHVSQLTKEYSVSSFWGSTRTSVRALSDVSFSMSPGQSLGLVGESGSGKTTLARLLLGFLKKDRGQILWDGKPQESFSPRHWAQHVQMIFQDPGASLNPKLTVGWQLTEALNQYAQWQQRSPLQGAELKEQLITLLTQVGMSEEILGYFPHQFSGGQRQRIAIARALAVRPRLLVADEPVSSLDLSVQAQILNLLMELRSTYNLMLLLISHDLAVVHQLTDTVVVLQAGHVVEQGETSRVLQSPQNPYTQLLRDAVPRILQ